MPEQSAVQLIENFKATNRDINAFADFLGISISKIESTRDTFENDKIFVLNRPQEMEGNFAYITTQSNLTPDTRANRFKLFFTEASAAMTEKGETSQEVDFIVVVGVKSVIVFDSADYRRRLILTVDKLSRDNSKYLEKFNSLKASSLLENKRYKEDEDFGDIFLADEFKTDLFRFAISDDEQFVSKTRVLRLNFWKRIQEDFKCQKIIRMAFPNIEIVGDTSQYYGDVISAILDTLVLRYLLVRILEGRFGYTTEDARKYVTKIGLGTSIDKVLESKAQFNQQEIEEIISKSGNKQLDLFEIYPISINDKEVLEIQEEQSSYMEEVYGGDLYVSDIATAATQIEKTLSSQEYALIWSLTSSTNLDFDLADVTPGTIGEQYEQTLKMNLTKDNSGNWKYDYDNTQQRDLGAFYTNSKITDYIIEITLGKKLDEIKNEVLNASISQRAKILRAVLNLKIADISSGGGTFLAGAVRRLGDWYIELEKTPDIKPALKEVKEKALSSLIDFQKYAVNHMIYGVDIDLKALIVSSFALTLESLGDVQDKLPELIGKSLIYQNSVISLVPEDKKLEWFESQNETIKTLLEEKKKWLSKKSNKFLDKRGQLQQIFSALAADYLATKKLSKEVLEKIFSDKHMEVLEFNLPEVFFDKDGNYTGGFDVVFGNPPYIQLQKKEIFSDIEKEIYKKLGNFQSYEATGDIYSLFFERGIQLLKPQGRLGFITSNKYLRAGYGKSLRNYILENTNPYQLVNLGSGMFGATVDTSILAIEKSNNTNELHATDLVKRARSPKNRIENMSDYIEQHKLAVSFQKDESWTILSPIEESIKQKIETVGTPLKDWNISISYGIKTGYNEAFIISGKKRQEILDNCQSEDEKVRTAELIRPILRGRDINRYSYEFADKYLITTYNSYTDSNGNRIPSIDINNYLAVKNYLDKYWTEISKRQDKGDTPYNLRRCAYMDDFNKPKLIWLELTDHSKFTIDLENNFVLAGAFLMTSSKNNLYSLLSFLNSKLIDWLFDQLCNSSGTGTNQWKKFVLERLTLPDFTDEAEKIFKHLVENKDFSEIEKRVNEMYGLNSEEINFINSL
ncbi:MAG TPA: TaqI-like C-terminal specificity domain-containing protein [Lactovum miscens]|uniref:Eco57I restriction-modification methylase domain-containing protein n=1 Tax=Lactovum miscens TaxID=190387 RepID=UPI002ED8B5F1